MFVCFFLPFPAVLKFKTQICERGLCRGGSVQCSLQTSEEFLCTLPSASYAGNSSSCPYNAINKPSVC